MNDYERVRMCLEARLLDKFITFYKRLGYDPSPLGNKVEQDDCGGITVWARGSWHTATIRTILDWRESQPSLWSHACHTAGSATDASSASTEAA